jgi:hypothetical protein
MMKRWLVVGVAGIALACGSGAAKVDACQGAYDVSVACGFQIMPGYPGTTRQACWEGDADAVALSECIVGVGDCSEQYGACVEAIYGGKE